MTGNNGTLKTIGLIGGMSYESSREYEDIINDEIRKKLGGLNSIKSLNYYFNFKEIADLQHAGKWDILEVMMTHAARVLDDAGADFIVICTNTMHLFAPQIEASINIPLLSIVDATAEKIQQQNIRKVALLGTRFTMEKDFYKSRLENIHGISGIIPDDEDREIIDDIIYKELCEGIRKRVSQNALSSIVKDMKKKGAEGVVLGCTELPLLLKQENVSIPLFDTMTIHALAAANFATGGK